MHKQDTASLKQRIFDSAISIFAEYGLKGARMEQIAAQASTTKRMVVYHFKSKEALYLAVLEHVYTQIRQAELQLNLGDLPPAEAIVQLVESSFDYHVDHPDFIRIICMENMQRGRYIGQSPHLKQLNQSALTLLDDILQRGQQRKIFKSDVMARDLHRLISSFSFHQVANQYTFEALFDDNDDSKASIEHYRQIAVKVVMRFLVP